MGTVGGRVLGQPRARAVVGSQGHREVNTGTPGCPGWRGGSCFSGLKSFGARGGGARDSLIHHKRNSTRLQCDRCKDGVCCRPAPPESRPGMSTCSAGKALGSPSFPAHSCIIVALLVQIALKMETNQ